MKVIVIGRNIESFRNVIVIGILRGGYFQYLAKKTGFLDGFGGPGARVHVEDLLAFPGGPGPLGGGDVGHTVYFHGRAQSQVDRPQVGPHAMRLGDQLLDVECQTGVPAEPFLQRNGRVISFGKIQDLEATGGLGFILAQGLRFDLILVGMILGPVAIFKPLFHLAPVLAGIGKWLAAIYVGVMTSLMFFV